VTTVLELAIGLLALVLAAVGAWYARGQLQPPKRELIVTMSAPGSLIRNVAGATDLVVTFADEVVTDPYLVTIQLEARGSHSITDNEFHRGLPMRVVTGKRILKTTTSGPSPVDVALGDDELELLIGPSLLNKGSRYTFQCLTDGRPNLNSDNVFHHDLVDVDVTVIRPGTGAAASRPPLYRYGFFLRQAALLVSVTGVVAAAYFFFRQQNEEFDLAVDVAKEVAVAGTLTATVRNADKYSDITLSTYDLAETPAYTRTQWQALADKNGTAVLEIEIPPGQPPGEISIIARSSGREHDEIDTVEVLVVEAGD
jgi:hypothetical protein